MTVTPIRRPTEVDRGRPMRPEDVAREIMGGTKTGAWVVRTVPRACRVAANTRPRLYWERLTREWWETGKVPESAA
ncbi:MAG TPA: hypothetical protein VFS33_10535 [Gemmatimonadales bacterium]|nr:hypothetical protein [Gemmatimonadales bacterium]